MNEEEEWEEGADEPFRSDRLLVYCERCGLPRMRGMECSLECEGEEWGEEE